MLRPAITVFDHGQAVIEAPVDAADPLAWLVGYALREDHRRDPQLGQCTACGDTAEHCPAWQVGWALQRASLGPGAAAEPAP